MSNPGVPIPVSGAGVTQAPGLFTNPLPPTVPGATAANSNVFLGPAGSSPSDATLQATINELAANGGGTIYLLPGTYILNSPVTLLPGVSIVGSSIQFPTAGLPAQFWSPLGGTIIQAGSALQGFIANATSLGTGSVPLSTFTAGMLSGVCLENLCFSGFSQGGLVIGAQNACGLVQSRLRRIFFYKCGSQGTTYSNGFFACSLLNPSESDILEIYGALCPNGLQILTSNNAGDQTGNCYVNHVAFDLTQLPAPNFARGVVLGQDPTLTNNAIDLIRLGTLSVYAFSGRSTISDTATFTGGGGNTQFTVANFANFPVGMPFVFSTGSGNTQANFTYFVLTNTGAAITYGNSRGGAAVTNTGSGSATIKQYGYPLLEIGGTVQGATNMQISGIDLENTPGNAGVAIYLENAFNTILDINAMTQPTSGGNIVGRNAQYTTIRSSGSSAPTPDFDANSAAQSLFMGAKATGIQFGNSGGGNFWDASNNAKAFNISGAAPVNNVLPDMWVAGPNGGEQIYPNRPMGKKVWALNQSSIGVGGVGPYTLTLSWGNTYFPGHFSLEFNNAATLTLPALGNAALNTSSKGQEWFFINISAFAMVIKPSANSSGQFINGASGLANNQVSLAAVAAGVAQWVRFVAQVNTAGVTYWAVDSTGTIS